MCKNAVSFIMDVCLAVDCEKKLMITIAVTVLLFYCG